VFGDEGCGEAGSRMEMAPLDGLEESGRHRAESTCVKEGCEGLFGVDVADGAVCAMSGLGWGVGIGRLFGGRCFWC
jgi:hypothetical protein